MDEINFIKNALDSLSPKICDQYEIYWEEKQRHSFQSKEGLIEQIEESLERGIALRLFRDSRKSFSCTSDFTERGLKKIVELAVQALPLMGEDDSFVLPNIRSSYSPHSVKQPSRDEMVATTLLLEKSARDFDRRISKVRDVRLEKEKKMIRILNSQGLDQAYQDDLYEISLMVVAEAGTQEMAWESDFNHNFSGLDPEKLGQIVAEKSTLLLGAQSVPTQRTPAIFDPLVTSSFLNVLAQSFCADQVYKGRSYLKGRLNTGVYAPTVTILEDPTDSGGYDRAPFDAEGVMSQRVSLVEKGVVKNFLTDLQTAQLMSLNATGHAVRSHYKEAPHVSPRHFKMVPGRFSTEELIEEMGKGFYIQDVIGAHTIDPVSGDFSLGATGLWIEGGKRRSAVRGVTISGNLHDIFRKIDKVASHIREYQSFGAPALLVRSIDVSGT